ncbi:MAG: peptidase [Hyphomicrobiales bacterium]|nr:MAG: peptidase [Hyphomicrobiales bacterium]
MKLKHFYLAAALLASTSLATSTFTSVAHADATPNAVLTTYSDIALASFEDSLSTAKALQSAVDAFLAAPSAASQQAAKAAWVAARVPYQQTEAYRFGNAIVDDWEGKVNAWPLDEGLIDYVDGSYGMESDANAFYTANVVANAKLEINGSMIDASMISPAFLQDIHEAGEVESNVSTGYHAIEFLLWGQDLNGTGVGAGARSYTDFDTANCTNGSCERRGDYLRAATQLLISDLEEMVGNWTANGAARSALFTDETAGLATILTGMGSLSYGELAGERMKLGLLLKDPEEEHDCFSDNTHNSHLYDAVGIRNVYTGHYKRVDGTVISGASLSELVAQNNADLDSELRGKLNATIDAMGSMVLRANSVEAYDQMIGEGNEEGNAVVQAAIDGLIDQTRSIERVIAALDLSGIEIEGSDSLDSPASVFE